MALIDKETIRAEIERRIENCIKNVKHLPCHRIEELCELLNFLDTIPEQPVEGLDAEMFKERGIIKEEYLAKSMDKVHLEMEIATYLQDWEDDDEIGLHLSTDEGCLPIELEDVRDLARHFYKLGQQGRPKVSDNSLERLEEDLGKEIEKCLKQYNMLAVGKKDFTDIARHFAEWGMNQMPLPEDTTIFLKGVAEGKRLMMENAVDGRYMKADGKVYVESWPLDIDPDSVKAGDEVKIIVIPEKSEKVK